MPTVAALMLAAAGCASPSSKSERVVIVRDDPKAVSTTTPSAAPSASSTTMGMATAPIDPDPQQMDGQMAMVKPVPPKPSKAPAHIAPTTKPMHLGGDFPATWP